jgi:hypothetical protein
MKGESIKKKEELYREDFRSKPLSRLMGYNHIWVWIVIELE